MYKSILQSTEHRSSPLPDGLWMMTQRWDHLLFIHWPVSPRDLAGRVPEELELDTYNGQAWITIIPFKVGDMRIRKLPPIPFLKTMLEVNVRTYVKKDGVSGIYFLV